MNYGFDLPAGVEGQVYDCALYIARDNPKRALTWVDEVYATMRSICAAPHAYPLDEEMSRQVGEPIRHRPFGQYLIFYQVDDNEHMVRVVLFIHANRDRSTPV